MSVFNVELSPGKLHRRFGETEFGRELSQRVRYDRYRLAEDGTPLVDAEGWSSLLHADINNHEHARLTVGLTKSFIRHSSELSAEEGRLLEYVANVHDWSEFELTDVNHSDKDEE